jgi:hypothetical protein
MDVFVVKKVRRSVAGSEEIAICVDGIENRRGANGEPCE